MKKILFTILLSLSCFMAPAEVFHLSLDRSVEIAKEKSYNMKTLENSLEIARQNYKVSMANYRTNVSLEATLPRYQRNIAEDKHPTTGETIFRSEESLNMSGNLVINQPLPTDGRVYLRSSYNLNNDYNLDKRSGMFDVILGLSQPLDAFYGFNSTRMAVKNAKLSLESAEKQYKRSELNLIYTISQNYYSLLSLQKSMEIAKLNLERQREASDISARKFAAGLIREVDALQMKVELATTESNFDQAVYRLYDQTNAFKRLLGLESQDSIVLVSDLSYEAVIVDPEEAVKLALANRLEIREDEISIEQSRLNLKQQKANGLPQASLAAEIRKVGTDQSLLRDSYGSSLGDMFSNLSDRPINYNVGLTVKVPIIDWGKNKAQVRVSELRLEQALLDQEQTERDIESQVRSLVFNIKSNLGRLQILEESKEIAEASFDITAKRFADGDIDSEAFAQDRTRLNNANLSYLNTYIDYQLLLIDLTRQTYYDFKTAQPIE